MIEDKIDWTKRLLRIIEEKYSPKYYCWLFSGGNDSLTDAPVMYEHGYPVACDECWESGCGYEKQEKGVQVL